MIVKLDKYHARLERDKREWDNPNSVTWQLACQYVAVQLIEKIGPAAYLRMLEERWPGEDNPACTARAVDAACQQMLLECSLVEQEYWETQCR